MFIHVFPDQKIATIHELETLTEFEIRCPVADAEIAANVIGHGAYESDNVHVWVPIEWIVHAADGQVTDGWESAFNKMIQFAKSKEWVNTEGTHLRAHIEATG